MKRRQSPGSDSNAKPQRLTARAIMSESERDLQAQREYLSAMKDDDLSLVFARAFVLGMRRTGYRNTATALNEFIDNAKQASAKHVHIAFGYDGAVKKDQPTEIAIIDDGHGMDGKMIRLAMMWGGSHRAHAGDRSGFGRFGFGLPTAALSQGEAYAVFSKTQGGSLWGVDFDVHELATYSKDGAIRIPNEKPGKLPKWLQAYVDDKFHGLPHGTIVLLKRLDAISWKTAGALQLNLLRQFGVYYRRLLAEFSITVNAENVKVIDPLFITETAEYYESADGMRAEALKPVQIPVKNHDTGRVQGEITVRYSYMPYRFAAGNDVPLEDDAPEQVKKVRQARFQILKEWSNGIAVMRHGRHIGVIKPPSGADGWFDLIHRDLHWGCEIDFPATLDEEFSITTSKQTVDPSQRIWELLKQHDVRNTIAALRTRRESERLGAHARRGVENAVEVTMKAVGVEKRRPFLGDDKMRLEESVQRLQVEVERRAAATGVDAESIASQLEDEIRNRPYSIARESGGEGPFYRVLSWGQQRRLLLNTDHAFYSRFYVSASDDQRFALLLLLFVIADAELDVRTDAGREFYQSERKEWSENLRRALQGEATLAGIAEATHEATPGNAA